MKMSHAVLALTLAASLTAVGCGSNTSTGDSSQKTTPAPSSTPAPAQDATSAIKSGATKLLSITSDLKTAIGAGDDAKIKTLGPQLEDTWSTFEDNVKAKFPDLYDQVEQSLDPEVAASKASPLDKTVIGKLNDQLAQTVTTLLQKVQ